MLRPFRRWLLRACLVRVTAYSLLILFRFQDETIYV